MAASERTRLPTRLAQSALSERYSRAKPLPMPSLLSAERAGALLAMMISKTKLRVVL